MKVSLGQLRESAQLVLPQAELQTVSLQRAAFEIHASGIAPPFDTDIVLRITGHKSGPDELVTVSSYAIECFTDSENPSDRTSVWSAQIQLAAAWLVTDSRLDEIDPTAIKGFSMVTAAPIIHPYAREALQSLTARSEYPAYTMGLLESVSRLPDDHEFEIEDEGPPM